MKNKKFKCVYDKESNTEKYIIDSSMKLFRYRICNNNNFKAFMNDELWASTPNSFNDPYDCSFVYKKKELYNLIDLTFDGHNIEVIKELENINCEKRKDIIISYIDILLKRFQKKVKTSMLIVCFSDIIDSEMMWGHYTDNGKGFALEYDYLTLSEKCKEFTISFLDILISTVNELGLDLYSKDYYPYWLKIYDIFKVKYINKKYNITKLIKPYANWISNNKLNKSYSEEQAIEYLRLLNDTINFDLDTQIQFSHTTSLSKSKLWKHESEWRLIMPNPDYSLFNENEKGYFCIENVLPSSIYLGEFITKADRYFLVNLAYKKRINIYQMYTKNNLTINKLYYKKLTDKDINNIIMQ